MSIEPDSSHSFETTPAGRSPKATKPTPSAAEQQIQSMQPIMEYFQSHPLLEKFDDMDGRDQARAMAMLLIADKLMKNPEDLHELRQKANFVYEMDRCLIKFAHGMGEVQSDLAGAQQMTATLFDSKRRKQRQEAYLSVNRDARLIDGITRRLDEETAQLATLPTVSKEYLEIAVPESNRIMDETVILTDPRMRETEDRVNGYLDVVDYLYETADKYPAFVRHVVQAVEEYKGFLFNRYGPGQDERSEDENTGGLFQLFGMKPPEKEDVPVYKNNVHLTAFLHSIYDQIPTVQEGDKKGKSKKKDGDEKMSYDAAEAKAFVDYLRSLADKKLLQFVREGKFFGKVADVLGQLYKQYCNIQKLYKESGVERQREHNPDFLRMRFRNRMQELTEEGRGEGKDILAKFNIQEPLELLRRTDFTKIALPQQAVAAGPEDAAPEKIRKMRRLFADIEEDLDLLSISDTDEHGDKWDVDAWVEELIYLKHDVAEHRQKKKRRSRLRIDRSRENLRFEARAAGIGALDLEQIPTTDDTFADVIGQGWRKVHARVEDVLDYAQFEFVNSRLGPRRRMSAHTLVIGPFGCGKNFFSRALTSDPRVIGIETTIGRLLTAWAGEAEANIGRLFREAQKKRDQHDKPAIIVADEFDAFFEHHKPGASTVDSMLGRMQKELQTMLDGNMDYDGVFLFGMTNEPHRIPGEIYRRMGQERVFVVDALTAEERVQLITQLLSHIPLSDDFHERTDFDEFAEETEHVNGDTIGKIAEYVYEMFRKEFRKKHPKRIERIEQEARDVYGSGDKLTPAQKVSLFRKGKGKDVVVTPAIFRLAAERVLKDPVTDGLRKKQEKFYEDVHDMLDAAFSGRPWPDPGFEPPSQALEE